MLSTLLLITLASSVQFPSTPREVEVSSRTAEDVEIMRRILVDGLDAALPDVGGARFGDLASTEAFVYTVAGGVAGNSTVQRSHGWYLPQAGALFTFDLRLPVVDAPEEASDDEDVAQEDDVWSRTAREVRSGVDGQSGGGVARVTTRGLGFAQEVQQRRKVLDPDAIAKVRDAVLERLARHGSRIEGLGSSDTITVALLLRGQEGLAYTTDGSAQNVAWLFDAAAARTAVRHMVIRVPASELASANGSVDVDRLRERSLVAVY